jgi:hypothetical protein
MQQHASRGPQEAVLVRIMTTNEADADETVRCDGLWCDVRCLAREVSGLPLLLCASGSIKDRLDCYSTVDR